VAGILALDRNVRAAAAVAPKTVSMTNKARPPLSGCGSAALRPSGTSPRPRAGAIEFAGRGEARQARAARAPAGGKQSGSAQMRLHGRRRSRYRTTALGARHFAGRICSRESIGVGFTL